MKFDVEIQIPTARKYAVIKIKKSMTIEETVKTYYDLSEAYWKEQKRRAVKKQDHDKN